MLLSARLSRNLSDFLRVGRNSAVVKEFALLKQAKVRRAQGLVLVEGVRLIEELLTSSFQPNALFITPDCLETPRGDTLAQGFPGAVYVGEESTLARLSDTESFAGVVAVAGLPSAKTPMLAELNSLLVLDGLGDPGNVGTLIRTARAAGVDGAVVIGGVDPLNAKVLRASAGAIFHLPIVNAGAQEIQAAQFCLVSMVVRGGENPYQVPLPKKIAFVLGNESHGLNVAQGLQVTIPMAFGCESLNVASAGAILMYEWRRRYT